MAESGPPRQLEPLGDDPGFIEKLLNWDGWEHWSPWIWIAGIVLGYVLLLNQHPLRSHFSEGWGLMRERGNGWAFGLVCMLTMSVTIANWWNEPAIGDANRTSWGAVENAAVEVHPMGLLQGVAELGGALHFSLVPAPENIPGPCQKVAWLNWLLDALWFALGFIGTQILVLFFTIRIAMPGRVLNFWGLLELAVQRVYRMGPVVLVLVVALPALEWWGESPPAWLLAVFFLLLLTFAFLQTAAAGDTRKRPQPVKRNFEVWKARPFSAMWFIVMVLIHGLLFSLLDHAASVHVMPGMLAALLAGLGVNFLRALLIVWLAASLAVFVQDIIPSKK